MLSEFWQAIVGSAVISTIISNLCLWWHKKNDYKRDYYKKIIDHRIEAYEKLSIYLDSVWTKKRSTALKHETEIYSCFENEEELIKARQLLLSYCPGIHWYSEDVQGSKELL